MVIGLGLMCLGALLFVPAASAATYSFFLAAEVVLAAGVTLLQVAANPYVTILGPPETASSRLNLTQAFNTLGDTVAPYIGGAFILGKIATLPHAGQLQGAALQAYRTQQASSIKLPFLAIASATLILALAIALYKFPRLEVTQDFRPGRPGRRERQHLESPPSLPRRHRDLHLRGRRSLHRQLPRKVLRGSEASSASRSRTAQNSLPSTGPA